jgi:AcrR family transcriptional regulator
VPVKVNYTFISLLPTTLEGVMPTPTAGAEMAAGEEAAFPMRPTTERGRQRCAAVLKATGELLVEGGLPAASIDAIHARSGVSKATIYKYWPTRTCVAIDAFAEHMAHEVPLPDTGTARGDLTEQLRRVSAFYAGPGGTVFAQLLAQSTQDPKAAQALRDRFLNGRQAAIRILWRRALQRGEVRAELDDEAAMDMLFGHRPLTREEADLLADAALGGLLAH